MKVRPFLHKIKQIKLHKLRFGLIVSIIAHTADKIIKWTVFTAYQMDKGTMITYRKLHKYSEPTRNKNNIYENARTMREKMYKKWKWMISKRRTKAWQSHFEKSTISHSLDITGLKTDSRSVGKGNTVTHVGSPNWEQDTPTMCVPSSWV